ncbi:MAG TPA: resuscitation-promoting factor RpfA, partial [Thermoanaerobaculia bacterium]|nr:resuscitation-promoting factor RpfA [Thermoanaerobaculia bacterium]
MPSPAVQPLARQLQWLIAIRLVVITSVALPYFLIQIAPREAPALEAPAPAAVAQPAPATPAPVAVETAPAVDA